MEIFGYTVVKSRELWVKAYEDEYAHKEQVDALKKKIADLEDKIWHQKYEIEKANDAKKRAQRDRAFTENQYQKVCKENRHLEAEIDRLKNKQR